MNDSRESTPLEDAMRFIEEQDQTYTDEALYDALVDAGYPSEVASEALRQREAARSHDEAQPAVPEKLMVTGEDRRRDAALVLIGGAALAWLSATLILWLLGGQDAYGFLGISVVILAGVLLLVLLLSLAAAAGSSSLRRGVQGAVTGFVVFPFVFFFGLAGVCVAIVGGGG